MLQWEKRLTISLIKISRKERERTGSLAWHEAKRSGIRRRSLNIQSDPLWRRQISQQTGNRGEIGLGFDSGAEDSGKLAAKILIGAGMADDDGTDNHSAVLLGNFQSFMGLMQFSL